jgi:hypothetical protein
MNTYLETAISIVLILLLFSIITYVIQELIAVNLRYRGKMLWKSLAQLLDGHTVPGRFSLSKSIPATDKTPFTDALFQHGEIESLQKDLKTLPSYIPASNFALAIMDIVAKKAPTASGTLFADFKSGLSVINTGSGDLAEVLKNLADTSGDIKDLQIKIEKWFNNYMDRVSGWYQSHAVVTIRLIALGVTLAFNLNLIKITREIANNSLLRSNLVGIAEQVTAHPESINLAYAKTFDQQVSEINDQYDKAIDSAKSGEEKQRLNNQKMEERKNAADGYTQKSLAAIDSLTTQLSAVNIPLGWNKASIQADFFGKDGSLSLSKIGLLLAGWLIAAGCISMGAPFWFNLLMQFVNLRRAGVKPDSKDKKQK